MKALSVLPPWWWFIVHGYKDIENRSWPTHHRGKVYLHVGKTFQYDEIMGDLWSICNEMPGARGGGLARENPARFVMELKQSAGCIVGTVDIVGCVTASSSPWFFGKYGFQLENAVAFERPIPWRGAMGLFDVPDGIEVKIE